MSIRLIFPSGGGGVEVGAVLLVERGSSVVRVQALLAVDRFRIQRFRLIKQEVQHMAKLKDASGSRSIAWHCADIKISVHDILYTKIENDIN